MKKLYGVTVAMITPFTEEGNVDVKALDKLTEMLITCIPAEQPERWCIFQRKSEKRLPKQ